MDREDFFLRSSALAILCLSVIFVTLGMHLPCSHAFVV